jgi:hypothetical protein
MLIYKLKYAVARENNLEIYNNYLALFNFTDCSYLQCLLDLFSILKLKEN